MKVFHSFSGMMFNNQTSELIQLAKVYYKFMIHTNIEASINDKCLKNSLYFIYVYCLSN